MKNGIALIAAALAASVVSFVPAQTDAEPAVTENESPWTVVYGADLRARFDASSHVPGVWNAGPGKTRSFYRMRTRGWFEGSYGPFKLTFRAVNEWRHYFVKQGDPNAYHWADELLADNLYLTLSGVDVLGYETTLRIGRQDLKLGSGRVIADVTSRDGSRTIFADAIRATVKISEKSTLDLFYIYQDSVNDLTIGDQERVMTQWGDEQAIGAYYSSKDYVLLPFEAYYVGVFGETTVDSLNTLGVRLMPSLVDHVTGELEIAYQIGEREDGRDISAYLVYAGVKGELASEHPCKPYAAAAVYMMSGDDGSGTDTAWKPVLARGDTQMSEFLTATRAEQWSNMIFPHVELGIVMAPDHRARFWANSLSRVLSTRPTTRRLTSSDLS